MLDYIPQCIATMDAVVLFGIANQKQARVKVTCRLGELLELLRRQETCFIDEDDSTTCLSLD